RYETVQRQAVMHIFARLNTRCRDSRHVSAQLKTPRQATDIHFCAAACVGKEGVGNVQNDRCLQSAFDDVTSNAGETCALPGHISPARPIARCSDAKSALSSTEPERNARLPDSNATHPHPCARRNICFPSRRDAEP